MTLVTPAKGLPGCQLNRRGRPTCQLEPDPVPSPYIMGVLPDPTRYRAALSMNPHTKPEANGDSAPGPRVKVFDFFSGCGGASRGFQDAGMDVVFALDLDSDARQTFELNFPAATFEPTDIRDTSEDIVYELVAKQRPNPILFCGCAPCQPFTKHNTIRPERDEDDRVPLLLDFLRFIQRCEPDIVFVENVPGIQNLRRDSEPLSGFLRGLEEAGYPEPACDSVPLMRYGVPQGRRRFLLLASRHGSLGLPPHTHGPETVNPDYDTVCDWIGDLPKIAAGETHPTIPDHRAARLSALNLKRIRATLEGGGNRDWPDELRLKCHEDATGYSDAYGRMSWDRPASGLTTRCISYSNGRFGHPEQDRAISVREAACLQTFPMDFQFAGSLSSMARQIGNAVPVRLAKAVGRHITEHLAQAGVI